MTKKKRIDKYTWRPGDIVVLNRQKEKEEREVINFRRGADGRGNTSGSHVPAVTTLANN